MYNILLLTDFSNNASNAIDYAMQVFSGENCRFYVLNVQKVSKYITSDLITSAKKSVHNAILKKPKKSLDILIKGLRKKYADEDYSFQGTCEYDSFISSVKQVIAAKNIDLIVMGTNGVSGIKETVFGSNTIHVVKSIDLPILVIPENYKFTKPDNILFINELDKEIDNDNIEPLRYFIDKFNTHLDVLTIDNETDSIKVFFKDVKLDILEAGNMSVENAIEHFATKNKTQLVAKIINTKSFFERIFSKSITSNITYASKVPLLFL